jgi:uncharacterized protein involved in type VI secretion and phage assembly
MICDACGLLKVTRNWGCTTKQTPKLQRLVQLAGYFVYSCAQNLSRWRASLLQLTKAVFWHSSNLTGLTSQTAIVELRVRRLQNRDGVSQKRPTLLVRRLRPVESSGEQKNRDESEQEVRNQDGCASVIFGQSLTEKQRGD